MARAKPNLKRSEVKTKIFSLRIAPSTKGRIDDLKAICREHGVRWDLSGLMEKALLGELKAMTTHIEENFNTTPEQGRLDLDLQEEIEENAQISDALDISDNAKISDSGISDSIDEMFEPLTKQRT